MRRIILLSLILTFSFFAYAQKADKPSIMIKPSDSWCVTNGYYQEVTNRRGITRKVADLEKAFSENPDLGSAVTTIAQMFIDRGLNVTSIWDEMKELQQQEEEMDAMEADEDADAAQTSNFDQAIIAVKPDIMLELNWQMSEEGLEKSIFVNIEGKDAYTNKIIAPMQNQSSPMPSGTSISVMVRQAVQGGFEQLTDNLMEYFNSIVKNGREIRISFIVSRNSSVNLYSEINGNRLDDIIRDWIRKNGNNGAGTVSPGNTKNRITFRGVRIPIQDSNGQKIDAYEWSKESGLKEYLKSLGVPVRIEGRGLGSIMVRIGAK